MSSKNLEKNISVSLDKGLAVLGHTANTVLHSVLQMIRLSDISINSLVTVIYFDFKGKSAHLLNKLKRLVLCPPLDHSSIPWKIKEK